MEFKRNGVERMSEFERIVNVSKAYDRRSDTPSINYGISSCRISFILKKDDKAVQFMFGTDWYLPETIAEYKRIGNKNKTPPCNLRGENDCGVSGWDVGYHSPIPMYEGQEKRSCNILEGECFYDGSSLRADENKEILIREGSEGVWKFLEKEWNMKFGEFSEEEAGTYIGIEMTQMEADEVGTYKIVPCSDDGLICDERGNVAYSDCEDTLADRETFLERALKDETFDGDKDIVKQELEEVRFLMLKQSDRNFILLSNFLLWFLADDYKAEIHEKMIKDYLEELEE